MIDISTIPNVGAPTANHDKGEFTDDITPGDGLGTPVREDWQSDLIYPFYEIMKLAGLSPDGSVEGATQSQVRNAIQAIANGIAAQRLNRSIGYAVTNNDFYRTVYVDTSAGDVSITLPLLADNVGRKIKIVHQRGGTNKVIIAPNAGDANTLTNDGLAVIWLPKVGDFIDFESQDSVNAVFWAAINERLSSQLRLHTFTGFGSTDTVIMQFTTAQEDFGNLFSHNHGSYGTAGLEIIINRSGKYGFSFTARGNAAPVFVGFSINSAQLTTAIPLITATTRLSFANAVTTGDYASCSWQGWLAKGSVIRAHGSTVGPVTVDICHFNASYLGN